MFRLLLPIFYHGQPRPGSIAGCAQAGLMMPVPPMKRIFMVITLRDFASGAMR